MSSGETSDTQISDFQPYDASQDNYPENGDEQISSDESTDQSACTVRTMLVLVTENIVHGLGTGPGLRRTPLHKPMLAVSTGGQHLPRCKPRSTQIETALEKYADKEQVHRDDYAQLVDGLIAELAQELASTKDWHRKREHRIPRWAVHAFAISVGVALSAVILEYVLVRRKEGVARSRASQAGSATTGGGGGAKTHMMFK